jgi:hypothetical protein
LFRVVNPLIVEHHRIVAGPLGFERQLAPCGPGERVEPVAGANAAREEQHQPVAAPDVLQFVDDRALGVGVGPLAGVGRHDDHRRQDAECDGSGHVLVAHHVYRPLNAPSPSQRLCLHAKFGPGQAGAADPSKAPDGLRDRRGEE